MNKNDTMKWEDIYKVWKWEMCKFPVLSAQKYCLKTEISKPRFGPCYSFNWIEKERRNLLNLMYIYAMIMQVLPLIMPVRQREGVRFAESRLFIFIYI